MKAMFDYKQYFYYKMNWIDLLGGTASGAVMVELIRLIRLKMENKKKVGEAINNVNNIYVKGMRPVLDNTHATRFLVCRTEDSGENIVPGVQLFLTVVYEDYRKPNKSVIEKYQRYLCDKNIIENLMKLVTEGYVNLKVSDLPEDSHLRNIYESENILYAELHYLYQTKDRLYFCSIGTTENKDFSDRFVRNEIDVSVNHVRNILDPRKKS